MNSDTKERVYLYARVSTTTAEQLTSFTAQQNYKSDNYEIIEVFADYGKTATKVFNRPNFIEMLKKCNVDVKRVEGNHIIFVTGDRTPVVNKILVSHTSRFMRNQIMMQSVLEALKKTNVEVIFLDMGKSSFDSDLFFTLNILFLLDEQESRNTSLKVKKGLEKAQIQRQYIHVGFGKVYGFDYIKSENRLVLNSDEAPIVKKIFNMYSEGKSVREVAKEINFRPNRVLEILRNEKYCGYNAYNKYYYDDKSQTRKRTKDYEIFKSDRIEEIVTKKLWDKCQEIRRSKVIGNRGARLGTYPMSGKIRCGVCGKNYFHKGTNKKGDLWECSSKKNNGSCDNICFNENTLKNFLLSDKGINNFKLSIENIIEGLLDSYVLKDKKELEEKLEKLTRKFERVKELYMEGDITKDEYIKDKGKILINIQNIEREIGNIDNFNQYYNETVKLKNDYIDILNLYKAKLENNELNEVFEKIDYIVVGRWYDEAEEKIKNDIREIKFKEFKPLYKLLEQSEFMTSGVF